jgi:hypothetical protein
MGKLADGFRFTGKLGPYTAYKSKDSDDIIIRTMPGKSGKKVDDLSPRVKENVTEFSLCATTSRCVRQSMKEILKLADYNFTYDLTSRAKETQVLDSVGARGERSVLISKHPQYLIGFNLNKKFLFDSIIRRQVGHSIDPSTGIAKVDLPAIEPGISLFLARPVPQYKIIMVLGLVADQLFHTPKNDRWWCGQTATATTGTLISGESYPARQFELVLPLPKSGPKEGALSYVLSIGIEIEIPHHKTGKLYPTGSSKILDVLAVVM